MNSKDHLGPEWDALLNEGLIEPPADFHAQVMRRVQQRAREPADMYRYISRVAVALQFVIVLFGALAAGWQTLSFVFGLWATSLVF